ncbi:hypothetical protein KSP40_PGU004820 [Platanthera guangdongensis]|uniref:Uncharacterized protein n=1 Tax=Platanthera guangdongensis TaxID=2320717 RepID=A0ABR2LYP1_9ASPA
MSIQNLLILLLFPILSSASTHSALLPAPKQLAVIEGMVYCQCCANAGSWSLADAKPLPLAKVGIACRDHKNRVWFYKAFQTDTNGYYYAPIEGLDGVSQGEEEEKKKEIAGCRVHLLSSADGDCNILTNVNMGISGAGVGLGKKIKKTESYEVVVYAAPPLAFRPGKCTRY